MHSPIPRRNVLPTYSHSRSNGFLIAKDALRQETTTAKKSEAGRQFCLLLLLIALLQGCGRGVQDPYPRVGYSGTVTLDGEPMEKGFLYLEPLEQQPTQSYAVIQDGQFTVNPSAGAVPGKYRVSIVQDDSYELPDDIDQQTPEGSAAADALSRATRKKALHPSYNIQSKLVAELESEATNEFDFELKSNPDQSPVSSH